MVEPLRHLENALMQRAAERDIQLLDAAADRQHRHVAPHRLADQRQCRRVAVRIVQRALHARRAAVMVRLDIRRAAGQQQTVEPVKQRAAIGLRADRRDQHRQAAGDLDDGLGILIGDGVKPALVDLRTQDGIPTTANFDRTLFSLFVGRS